MGKTLQQLTAENMALLAKIWEADGELDEETELALDVSQAELSIKVDSYCNLIELIEADIVRVADKVRQYTEMKNRLNAKRDHIRQALLDAAEQLGATVLDGEEYTARRTTSQRVVVVAAPEQLPPEFVKTETKVLKADIKTALKNGREIEGCRLEESEGLRIRPARRVK